MRQSSAVSDNRFRAIFTTTILITRATGDVILCCSERFSAPQMEVGADNDGFVVTTKRRKERAAARRELCTKGDRFRDPCRRIFSGAGDRDTMDRL